MTSDDERREVARRLRELGGYVFCPGNTYELLADALLVADFEGTDELFARLADLIDPTCEARRDTVFKPAVLYPDTESDDVGYEETVYRCGRCGEIVSYDEDYDQETDLPAYCERCGSRITGIGEPWDE